MQPAPYTTRLQAGLGLLSETRALLEIWQPGMSAGDLYRAALASGSFPNVSARRLRNIVTEGFAPRYLSGGNIAAGHLKRLLVTLPPDELRQILFLHTCRANPILADCVRELYWPAQAQGDPILERTRVIGFIQRALDDGKTRVRWSDGTVNRVANYLLGCCADFGLLGKGARGGRAILSFAMTHRAAAYLAHELHVRGIGDEALVAHPDWQLFGHDRAGTLDLLKRLALQNWLILQSAGDVTHIGWRNRTMEAFLDALAED
jgi:hypothetical protein